MATVLQTDLAWPDDSVERQVVEAAGLQLVVAPHDMRNPEGIRSLCEELRPDAIMTCWAVVTAAAIDACPGLRIVARMGVGLDNIAVPAATAKGAWVTNVPDYCVEEVSDHALAMVLAWARGLLSLDRRIRHGVWSQGDVALRRMSALTCGIVGYGNIGRATARKLAAFGCTLLAHTPRPTPDGIVTHLSLDDLLERSDVVIIHAPLNESTKGLINARSVGRMKQGALLVNVSRGGIVESQAVVDALAAGRLSAAALDVFDTEPEVPAALKEHERTILSPHAAFSSDASLVELRRRAAEEVVRVLSGQAPRHPCNSPLPAA